MKKQTSGVYRVVCHANGRVYIGSSKNIERRLAEHKRALRQGRHHCAPLQGSWDKYGKEAFTWEVLEPAPIEQLTSAEQRYLDAAFESGRPLNVCPVAGSFRGRKATKEQKQAMSERSRRLWADPTYREKVRKALRGRTVTQETRQKLSAAATGRTPSAETRAKWSQQRKGRTHSEETKAKMSRTRTGQPTGGGWTLSPETRARMSASKRGKRNYSKVSLEDVADMCRRYLNGETQTSIGKAYGLHQSTVSYNLKKYLPVFQRGDLCSSS